MWIKKVATTPLNTIAKVIDSLSGSSTENAPSIHAVNTALNGKANSSHTHTKSQITDFPTFQTTTQQFTVNNISATELLPTAFGSVDITKSGWTPIGLVQCDSDIVDRLYSWRIDPLLSVSATLWWYTIRQDFSNPSYKGTLHFTVLYYKFE